MSDAIRLEISPLTQPTISLYLPGSTADGVIPLHQGGRAIGYFSVPGNHVVDPNMVVAARFPGASLVVVLLRPFVTASGVTPERMAMALALSYGACSQARAGTDMKNAHPPPDDSGSMMHHCSIIIPIYQ